MSLLKPNDRLLAKIALVVGCVSKVSKLRLSLDMYCKSFYAVAVQEKGGEGEGQSTRQRVFTPNWIPS